MRKILAILLVLTVAGSVLFARGGQQAAPADRSGEKKIIHLKSDLSGPVAPGDSVLFLVGNVAAQHNGAVITCDSAVRYSDTRVECFGNVLINKNTTYMYGERADYNGTTNEVRVYSKLVKVIDGEATLYAPHFSFNTKDNVGEFWGGGVLINREHVMEAQRGYFFSDTKELVAVDEVEMRNDEYAMKGDSVIYNTESENAFFHHNTHIWDADGNYLSGHRGEFSKAEQRYMVTEQGYLLTETQELWSDTLDYFRADQYVILRNNLQIDETEQKNLIFGDYGEYWEVSGNGFLTKNPVVVNYDTERNADTIFMRSDSLYLYMLKIGDPIPNEYAPKTTDVEPEAEVEPQSELSQPKSPGMRPSQMEGLSISRNRDLTDTPVQEDIVREEASEEAAADADEVADPVADGEPALMPSDSTQLLPTDSIPADTLSVKERRLLEKQRLKEAARAAAELRRAERAAAKKILLDSIAIERQKKTNAKLRQMEVRDSIRQAARRAKARAQMQKRLERDHRRGILHLIDSVTFRQVDSAIVFDMQFVDSVMERIADSLDSLHRISLIIHPSDTTRVVDSIYRFVKGFRNVKIYRKDFQAVCDSLTARSLDSTAHLYIKPVLWNETNQITSEVMDLYMANGQMDHAEFVGTPMMASQFDTVYYDQITGKEMEAYFADNELYRVDVNGNVQTIFFQKDGVPQQVVMMAVIESGDATFYIEDRQLDRIVYRTNPVWPIYPIDGVPADVSMYLKGFRWEGDRRPSRDEIFDRTIRPSKRHGVDAKAKPQFPIRAQIDRLREKLVKEGRWADRNDEVDIQTVEWMRSLGFEVGQPHPGRE